MGAKRRQLLIRFSADAAGGAEVVTNALHAINSGQPFLLPPAWRVVDVRAGLHDLKEKTLHLEYTGGDDGDEATQSEPPDPSKWNARELIG